MSFKITPVLLDQEMTYTGPQLRPHWILETARVYGSALASFQGPCKVETSELVDWEDRLANDRIEAKKMIHFLAEFFNVSLAEGVLMQRLFMVWAERLLNDAKKVPVFRKGDDLYAKVGGINRKLSVSIATASSVSVLIHWGINIDATGAPKSVDACGLHELGWSPREILDFTRNLMTQYIGELEEISLAQCKVRPV